jgi:hypothetical protein
MSRRDGRKRTDIEVKDGNNVYAVRLVNGVAQILIRIDKNDDYEHGDGLLSPYERKRIIDLAFGSRRANEARCSTNRTRRHAVGGVGNENRVEPLTTGLLRRFEQFFRAGKHIINVVLAWRRENPKPRPNTATTTEKILRDQIGAGGLRLVVRGNVGNGRVQTPNAGVQPHVSNLQLVGESRKTTDDAVSVAKIIQFNPKDEWSLEFVSGTPATVVQMEEPIEDYVRLKLGKPDMTYEEVYEWVMEKRREYALADKLAEKRNRKLVLLPSPDSPSERIRRLPQRGIGPTTRLTCTHYEYQLQRRGIVMTDADSEQRTAKFMAAHGMLDAKTIEFLTEEGVLSKETLVEKNLLSKIIEFTDGTDAGTRKYRATLAWYQEQLRVRGVIITDKQFKEGLSVYMATHGMFRAGIVEYLKQEGVLQADVDYPAREWALKD